MALLAAPALAGASTLYVSEHPSVPGKSCAHAGFKEVQQAINEADVTPGTKIEICGGTYAEQLEITGPMTILGKASAKVTLPASIKESGTACDETIDSSLSRHNEDLLSICTSGLVRISGVTLEAKFPTGCGSGKLYNTIIGGGGALEATKVVFQNAGVAKSSDEVGCQTGVGIQVGVSGASGSASLTAPALEAGHAVLKGDTIAEYQKNGITVDGDGSSATIGGAGAKKVTIKGDGPVGTGQNGIQVSRGAVASINGTTISGDECDVVGVCGHESASELEEDGAGVLMYLAGAGTTVEKSTIEDNDVGIEYISGEETRALSPEVTLASNKVLGGYVSVQLNQGNATMKSNKLTNAFVALDVNESEIGGGFGTSSEYAPVGTSTKDFLEGSEAAVKVESSVGSLAGELSLFNDSVVGPIVNVAHPNYQVNG